MTRQSGGRIVVFAKAPRMGAVMTRMIPRLGAAGAAGLHAVLVRRALTVATASARYPVELWCAPSTDDSFFAQCARDFPVSLHTQQGEDLGQRMQQALDAALTRCEAAVLIGTDCPTLSTEHIEEAVRTLQAGEDAVVAPAEDGGYVLLGVRRTDPALFAGIEWGTAGVMAATRERLDVLGWRWRTLEELPDLDNPEDLDRLRANADQLSPQDPLRAWLAQYETAGGCS